MEINWDSILAQAEDPPRIMLEELLGRADEIKELVIVFHDYNGGQHTWKNTSSLAMSIGMLAYAQHCCMLEIDEAG